MQLGFVSAILGDQSLEEVLAFASEEGFACVELMCWPPGKADRRYAGVSHLDVTQLDDEKVGRVQELQRQNGWRSPRSATIPTRSTRPPSIGSRWSSI